MKIYMTIVQMKIKLRNYMYTEQLEKLELED